MKFWEGRSRIITISIYCLIIFWATIFLFMETSFADDAEEDIPQNIIINEIYPNPDPESCELDWCGNEWIELANLSDEDMSLSEYTIEDWNIYSKQISDPANYNPFELKEFTISAHGLLLLEKQDFSFTLNNDAEKIVLRKNGDILIEFSYGPIDGVELYRAPLKGQSYALFEPEGWKCTTSPTPGEMNVLTDPEAGGQGGSEEPIDIIAARDEPNGASVIITGIVTAPPDVLSSQYFYIQDETGGMQIYSYYKNFPELIIGDVIQAVGKLSEISGERRLKIDSENDVTIIKHEEPLHPKQVEIQEIGENLEGQYVKVAGTVSSTSGDTFTVCDSKNNQIKVVIKDLTDINKPKMRKGDQVEISGIVSQYKNEYRLLPIRQEDVKMINQNTLADTGLNFLFYPTASLVILLLWNISQKKKRILTILQKKSFIILNMATFLL